MYCTPSTVFHAPFVTAIRRRARVHAHSYSYLYELLAIRLTLRFTATSRVLADVNTINPPLDSSGLCGDGVRAGRRRGRVSDVLAGARQSGLASGRRLRLQRARRRRRQALLRQRCVSPLSSPLLVLYSTCRCTVRVSSLLSTPLCLRLRVERSTEH